MPFDPQRHLYLPESIRPDSHPVRIRWSPQSNDLNVNMVHLGAGESIDAHANDLLDVLVTVLDGSGHLRIDDQTVELRSGVIVLVPKGTIREFAADGHGVIYTTCHGAKGGLMPRPPRRSSTDPA